MNPVIKSRPQSAAESPRPPHVVMSRALGLCNRNLPAATVRAWFVLISWFVIAGTIVAQPPAQPASEMLLPSETPPADETLIAGSNDWLTHSFPESGSRPAGFRATVRVGHDPASVYLPVEIDFVAPTGFTADRRFTVRVRPAERGYSPPENGITCNLPVMVPQGTRQLTVRRMIPKASFYQAVEVSILENGQTIDGYSSRSGQLIMNPHQVPEIVIAEEVTPRALLLTATEAPRLDRIADLRTFQYVFVETPLAAVDVEQPSGQTGLLSTIEQAHLATASPTQIPTDWRNLQAFSALIVFEADLVELAEQFPRRLNVVRDWLLCGGSLIVVHHSDHAQQIQALNFTSFLDRETVVQQGAPLSRQNPSTVIGKDTRRYVQMQYEHAESRLSELIAQLESFEAQQQMSNSNEFGTPSWSGMGRQVIHGSRTSGVEWGLNPSGFHQTALSDQESQQLISFLTTQRRGQHGPESVAVQRVGAGQIIGIQTPDVQTPPTLVQWLTAKRLIGERVSAVLRRGVDPILGDERFTRWLIPGVAEPPVYAFMGLLTVFVVLVGPVAYRQTTRRGRGYLMFAIAPVLASITTISMFTYGILADGFGTVARIRQITLVDGQSGDGAQRLRSAYFAGIRPSEGLRFDGQAEVTLYPSSDGSSWERRMGRSSSMMGTVAVTDREQVFGSSFLPSREQRQFVIHQPRREIGRLDLNVDASRPGNVTATASSTFDFELHDVVIRDEDGTYWSVAKLPSGSKSSACVQLSPQAASVALAELYHRQRLISVNDQRQYYSSYRRQTHDLVNEIGQRLDMSATAGDGVFEASLQHSLQLDAEIPSETFVALADIKSDVLAVKSADIVDSIHYVLGTLP